jgi:hypothetical protein
MLAAQMQKSADNAAATVPVIVTAARPVAIVGKMLEHEVEQLHRLCDFRFWQWFERSRCGNERTVARAAAIRSAVLTAKQPAPPKRKARRVALTKFPRRDQN